VARWSVVGPLVWGQGLRGAGGFYGGLVPLYDFFVLSLFLFSFAGWCAWLTATVK